MRRRDDYRARDEAMRYDLATHLRLNLPTVAFVLLAALRFASGHSSKRCTSFLGPSTLSASSKFDVRGGAWVAQAPILASLVIRFVKVGSNRTRIHVRKRDTARQGQSLEGPRMSEADDARYLVQLFCLTTTLTHFSIAISGTNIRGKHKLVRFEIPHLVPLDIVPADDLLVIPSYGKTVHSMRLVLHRYLFLLSVFQIPNIGPGGNSSSVRKVRESPDNIIVCRDYKSWLTRRTIVVRLLLYGVCRGHGRYATAS